MGDGNKLVIIINTQLPFASDLTELPKEDKQEKAEREHHSKENGSSFSNRHWRESAAKDLRNSLLSLLPNNGEMPHQTGKTQAENQPFGQQNTSPGDKFNPHHSQNTAHQTSDRANPQNTVNQTLDEIINTAKTNENFTQFKNQPKEFWDNVRQMSEMKIVEKYVNGILEPRATSRYGEILEKFTRQGGQLNNFVNSLPAGEREVFQARYLLNQTLGVNELFIGQGVAIDKSGQFVVREFLANNGKSLETSLNTILGMLGGKFSEGSAASLFANGQILLNAKTAALLSLSLALYQNVNSTLPFTEVLPQIIPQNFLGKTSGNGGTNFVDNNLDNAKVNIERRSGETLIAAALINGALVVVDERGESKTSSVNAWTGNETVFTNIFSAGATGAMLGAIIGCVVPLSETNVGTALGFAASVVVGTSERGLRYLSANLLISDVITSGVQTFLSSATTLFLSEKPETQDLLKQQLSNHRRLAYLAS